MNLVAKWPTCLFLAAKRNKIVMEIPDERSCGTKIFYKKIWNWYENARQAALWGKKILKSHKTVIKMLAKWACGAKKSQ